MACNTDKKKYRCDGRHSATCTFYEGKLPEDSKLKEESCVTTAETTDELYRWVGELRKDLDKSKIEKECFEFDKDKDTFVVFLNSVVKKICDLEKKLKDSGVIDSDSSSSGSKGSGVSGSISLNKIDTSCLTEDSCGNKITDVNTLLQEMLRFMCKLKNCSDE